jgi:hypothetical protein
MLLDWRSSIDIAGGNEPIKEALNAVIKKQDERRNG